MWDIELAGYLANAAGPVPLVLDLFIIHERFERSSDPSINGHLHLTLSPWWLLFQVRPGVYIVNLCAFYSYRPIGKLTALLQLHEFSLRNMTVASTTTAARRSAHSSRPKWATSSPRLQLCVSTLDGASIASKTHTHPLHSQNSRLLTSSLFLGVPVPRATQCMRGV